MPKEKDMPATLTLVLITDVNGDGVPNHGDTINFAIEPPDTVWAQVTFVAYQPAGASEKDRQAVASAVQIPTYAYNLTLSSGVWASGAADCVAQLLGYPDHGNKMQVLAELRFTVAA
jgi:hypothetical protein